MPDPRRIPPEPQEYPGPESSGPPLHPRLRATHRLAERWTIRCTSAQINPRRMGFVAQGPGYNEQRRFEATQDVGAEFVEIVEIDTYHRDVFFDVPNEPGIARFILKAFDVQWPAGPYGTTRWRPGVQ